MQGFFEEVLAPASTSDPDAANQAGWNGRDPSRRLSFISRGPAIQADEAFGARHEQDHHRGPHRRCGAYCSRETRTLGFEPSAPLRMGRSARRRAVPDGCSSRHGFQGNGEQNRRGCQARHLSAALRAISAQFGRLIPFMGEALPRLHMAPVQLEWSHARFHNGRGASR